MSRSAIILDTETTSLVPDYTTGAGTIWELAILEWDGKPGRESVWRTPANLDVASPEALEVGHYHERTASMRATAVRGAYDLTRTESLWTDPADLATVAWAMTDGATIIGAVPSFDERFLTALLARYGHRPPWHHRVRDIGSMAWAYLHARGDPFIPDLDAGTDKFAVVLGIDPGEFERHSALGDCRLVAAMLTVIQGGLR